MDGKNSYVEIADTLDIDFELVKQFGQKLINLKLAKIVRNS